VARILKHIVILLLISGAIFCSFLPSLKANFLRWDDHTHLYENETVLSLTQDNVKKIFIQKVHHTYIPLTILSFAVEYHFFQDNPYVYHLNNLILHILVSVLVYLLALRFGLHFYGAALAALLFGLHPMHVESVAWITERKDVLYSLFYMLALLCYERRLYYLTQDKNGLSAKFYFSLVHLFGLLSILSKPMAMSLPLILLLVDWFKSRKMDKSVLIEKSALFVVISAVTFLTYMEHSRVPFTDIGQAVLVASWSFLFYLRQFILPLIMVPIVRLPLPLTFANQEYLYSFVVVLIVLFCFIRMRKSKWIGFAFLFFLFSVFFLIRFDAAKDTNIVADRFMYLPSLGICLLFGYSVQKVFEWLKGKHYAVLLKSVYIVLIFILFAKMSVTTYKQVHVWQNDVALWRHQLIHYPNEPIALNGLVAALRKYEDIRQAEEEFRKIVKLRLEGYELRFDENTQNKIKKVNFLISLLDRARQVAPDYVDIPYKLGMLYQDLGLYKNAVEMYRQAIEIDPFYKKIYFQLGLMYTELSEEEKAFMAFNQYIRLPPIKEKEFVDVIDIYNEAYSLDPNNIELRSAIYQTLDNYVKFINKNSANADSYHNLGAIYLKIGDITRAKSTFEKVLAINPRHVKALYSLGNIYLEDRNWNEALNCFLMVIRYDPGNSDAFVKMGNIYNQKGSLEKSQEYYQKAIKVNPKNARAYFNLAYTYETSGKYSEAVNKYKSTLQYNPENPDAYYNLGNVYLKLDKNQEAISSYRKTVELNPNHLNAWINLAITSYNNGDQAEARKYYDEAVLLGFEPSADILQTFEAIH